MHVANTYSYLPHSAFTLLVSHAHVCQRKKYDLQSELKELSASPTHKIHAAIPLIPYPPRMRREITLIHHIGDNFDCHLGS